MLEDSREACIASLSNLRVIRAEIKVNEGHHRSLKKLWILHSDMGRQWKVLSIGVTPSDLHFNNILLLNNIYHSMIVYIFVCLLIVHVEKRPWVQGGSREMKLLQQSR